MLRIEPANITASAVPSELVAPWTWEPTYSQPSGTPTHRPMPPTNMITTSTRPLPPVRRRSRMP